MGVHEGNVMSFNKDEERFVFLFDDEPESERQLLQTLGQMAADLDLSLSWYDAAVLTSKARQLKDR